MTPTHGKRYRFERYITKVVVFTTIFILGPLLIYIFSKPLKGGLPDFKVERATRAKSWETATTNKLVRKKKGVTENREYNFVAARFLISPLSASMAENHLRELGKSNSDYLAPVRSLYLRGVDLFEQTFANRPKTDPIAGLLKVRSPEITSGYRNQTLLHTRGQQYLLQLYPIDGQFTSLAYQFVYKLSELFRISQRYPLFNLIAIGLILLLTGGMTSYFYIRNLKRWQRQIIKQNEELQLIFSHTRQGILLVTREGKILNSNPYADELLLNDSQSTLKDRSIYDVLQVKREEVSDFLDRVQRQETFMESMPIYREDGTEIIVNISASAIEKARGKPLFCLAIEDETETMSYLSQLNASERTYRDLINNVQDAIFIQDRNGVIIQANVSAFRMFGYDVTELKGRTAKEILADQSLEQHNPELLKQAFEGERKIFDRWAQKKDGTIFPIEITLSKGKFFGQDVVISIIRDISERHESIKELQAANKRNQILLQEIHHRVKNNMALISGLLNLQSFDVDDPNVQSILGKSQKRIHAVADVHEFLYQSNDLVSLDFKSYLDSFIKNFTTNVISDHSMDIRVNAPSFNLNVNQAMPAALLLNEILLDMEEQSSLPADKREITIDMEISHNTVYMDIRESSASPSPVNNDQSSLGWDIIRSLVRQLDAKWAMSLSDGQYHVQIQFKRKKNLYGSSSNLSLN